MPFFLFAFLLMSSSVFAAESTCIPCHIRITPQIVQDFRAGKMGKAGLDCSTCHGTDHQSDADLDDVDLPTEKTCRPCHQQQYDQYMQGKHSLAWVAMDTMPKTGFHRSLSAPGCRHAAGNRF